MGFEKNNKHEDKDGPQFSRRAESVKRGLEKNEEDLSEHRKGNIEKSTPEKDVEAERREIEEREENHQKEMDRRREALTKSLAEEKKRKEEDKAEEAKDPFEEELFGSAKDNKEVSQEEVETPISEVTKPKEKSIKTEKEEETKKEELSGTEEELKEYDDDLSSEEWKSFVHTGKVSDERLSKIAKKIRAGEKTSEREISIFGGNEEKMERLLNKDKEALTNTSAEEVKEEVVATSESLKEHKPITLTEEDAEMSIRRMGEIKKSIEDNFPKKEEEKESVSETKEETPITPPSREEGDKITEGEATKSFLGRAEKGISEATSNIPSNIDAILTAPRKASAYVGKKISKTFEKKDIEKNIEKSSAQEQFKDFGVSGKELEKIKGYKNLSEGQKFLVAENLRQLSLGRIQEEARGAYKEKTNEAKFLGRIWQSISKKYQIAKLEKVSANEIYEGGMKVHGKVLEQLVRGAGEGPGAEMVDGELEVQYITGVENMPKENKEKATEFNKIATEFSKIPDEWRYETADKKDRARYAEIKEKYEASKKEILNSTKEVLGEKGAALAMAKIDTGVYSNQFFNTHPDAEDQIRKITKKWAGVRIMKDIIAERGLYFGAGFAARSAAVSIIGLVAVPVVAGVMGGFMSRGRAKESMKERDITGRKGGGDYKGSEALRSELGDLTGEIIELDKAIEKEENGERKAELKIESRALSLKREELIAREHEKGLKNMVEAGALQGKLEQLSAQIETEEDPKKKAQLVQKLQTRLGYTQTKIEDGLVNYGGADDRLSNQYELVKSLGLIGAQENIESEDKTELDLRLEKFLESKETRISEDREWFLKKEFVKGMGISAGFASVGQLVHYAGEEWGFWGESSSASENVSDTKPEDITPTKPENVAPENIEQTTPPVGKEVEIPPIPPSVAEVPEALIIKHTVVSGDNLWKIISGKLEEQGAFKGMSEAGRTHLIDSMKDRFAEMSGDELREMNISSGDINNLRVGDNLNLTSVLGDMEGLGEARVSADMLTEIEQANIIENNETIAAYAEAHPEEAITAEKIEEILHPTETVGEAKPWVNPDEVVSDAKPWVNPDNVDAEPRAEGVLDPQTQEVMNKRIEKIYKRGFPFFGNQIDEWTGTPEKGILGIKDMEAAKILKKDFGEPFGRTMDTAESGNRKELFGVLSRIRQQIGNPISGETTEKYMTRGFIAGYR